MLIQACLTAHVSQGFGLASMFSLSFYCVVPVEFAWDCVDKLSLKLGKMWKKGKSVQKKRKKVA